MGIDPLLLSLLVACLFVLLFGALALMRREGLSAQFALEALALTVVLVGGTWLLGIPLNPFFLLVVLYLTTMRCRLAVDLGNVLAQRGHVDLAFRAYRFGLACWPDASTRLIALTNWGVAELRSGQVDAAILTLEDVLATEHQARLGLKYEAACRYNLGFAYEKKGEDAKAVAQYNHVVDLMPGSIYAHAARSSLERRRKRHAAS